MVKKQKEPWLLTDLKWHKIKNKRIWACIALLFMGQLIENEGRQDLWGKYRDQQTVYAQKMAEIDAEIHALKNPVKPVPVWKKVWRKITKRKEVNYEISPD